MFSFTRRVLQKLQLYYSRCISCSFETIKYVKYARGHTYTYTHAQTCMK